MVIQGEDDRAFVRELPYKHNMLATNLIVK